MQKFRRMVKTGFHDAFRPMIIIHIGTTAHFLNRLFRIIIAYIGLIPAVLIGIILRGHISTAAPVFIAHAEKVHRPWLLVAVSRTLIRHRRYSPERHIFYPLGHLLHRSASEIPVNVGFTSDLAAQLHEFMGSEAIVLHNTAPMGIDHFLSSLLRTDSVLPVILIRKTAARPAQHRHLQLLQCLHHVCSHAIDIGNIRVFSDVNPLIDAASQMLGKMSVNFRCNRALLVMFINMQSRHFTSSISVSSNDMKKPVCRSPSAPASALHADSGYTKGLPQSRSLSGHDKP